MELVIYFFLILRRRRVRATERARRIPVDNCSINLSYLN